MPLGQGLLVREWERVAMWSIGRSSSTSSLAMPLAAWLVELGRTFPVRANWLGPGRLTHVRNELEATGFLYHEIPPGCYE
jgi:hypothetical protein